MLRFDHLMQAMVQFGSKVVVEEKLHAASDRSNSTASRTDKGGISNQRATSFTEPFVRSLDDLAFPSADLVLSSAHERNY